MLPKESRIPKEDIPDVMRHGERIVNEALMLCYKNTAKTPRFAFVVSTKVDKRATSRNRIRRILSESVRHVLPRLRNVDGVFIVRKNIAELSQGAGEKLVMKIFSNANLI